MTNLVEAVSVKVNYPYPEGTLKLYDEGVTFGMREGDFTAVLGGSGWGKSTLVNVMLGLEKPTWGRVYLNGTDVTSQSFVRRCSLVSTAAVFQRPTAVPQLTVSQNLSLALSMAEVPKNEREARIGEALAFFGLDKLSSAYPDSLSAGQRRRVDLARALAVRPKFLVMDEPTGDLDNSASNLVMPLLRGLNRDHGVTILMTTALPRCASHARHLVHLKPPGFVTSENRMVGS